MESEGDRTTHTEGLRFRRLFGPERRSGSRKAEDLDAEPGVLLRPRDDRIIKLEFNEPVIRLELGDEEATPSHSAPARHKPAGADAQEF